MPEREIVINGNIDTKCDSWKMFIKYLIREVILPDLTKKERRKNSNARIRKIPSNSTT